MSIELTPCLRCKDESVTVRIVLRLSNCSEDALKVHLPRLEVGVNVAVFTPTPTGPDDTVPGKEVVFTGSVNTNEDPLVVVNMFEGDNKKGNHVYVIWKVETFLRE